MPNLVMGLDLCTVKLVQLEVWSFTCKKKINLYMGMGFSWRNLIKITKEHNNVNYNFKRIQSCIAYDYIISYAKSC